MCVVASVFGFVSVVAGDTVIPCSSNVGVSSYVVDFLLNFSNNGQFLVMDNLWS